MLFIKKWLCFLLLIACVEIYLTRTVYAQQVYSRHEVDINGLVFKIDPRIELLYSVGCVGGYPYMNKWDFRYKDEVNSYFLDCHNHNVIKLWQKMGPKGFALDGPIFHVIRNVQNLNSQKDINSIAENDYQKFSLYLKDFARDTNFAEFYNLHSDFYELVLSTIKYNISDYNIIPLMEKYFGQKQNSYTVIINLMGSGNFAPRVQNPSGLDIYCVMEPQVCCGDIPTFSDCVMLDHIIIHEFAHSFINPLVDTYTEQVNEYGHLLEPIQASMSNQGYNNWNVVVKEHIVRAVNIRLAALKYGEAFADLQFRKLELGMRYIYVDILCEKLKEYESNRGKYSSFQEFFPELIKCFSQINDEQIETLHNKVEIARFPNVDTIPKPMNGFDKKNVYIVKPTHEADVSQQEKLYLAIEQYKKWYYPNAQIITDIQAMTMDITKHDLIVFGTPSGNTFLEKYLPDMPFVINDTQLVADKVYSGIQYQLIAGWVNPLNVKRKMTIYTAQNVQLMNSISSVSLANDHYIIANNNKTVKYGSYERFMKIWYCR